jgi:hypothetical protein
LGYNYNITNLITNENFYLPSNGEALTHNLVLFFLLIVGLMYSCKKDLTTTTPLDDATQTAAIKEAKAWFEANASINKQATQATQAINAINDRKWSEGVSLDWNKPLVYNKNKITLVEMPLVNSSVVFAINHANANGITQQNNYTTTSFIVQKDSAGVFRGWFMVLIADTSYVNGNFAKLKLNTYKSHDKDFSGRLMYYNPKGEFLAGWRYEKGSITKTLSVATQSLPGNQPKQQVNSQQQVNLVMTCFTYPFTTSTATCVTVSSTQTDCTYTSTTSYITECFQTSDGGGGGGGGGAGGGGTPGNDFPQPPVPNPCPPVAVASVGGQHINLTPGGGGGGGGGTNPCTPVPPKDIKNEVKDPCLNKMVGAVINKDVTTVVNELIQNVFGGSAKVNITYSDALTLNTGQLGFTPPPASLDANGNLTITVYLNKAELPNASQEFISTVIIHESLHAYLTTTGSLGQLQHNTIASTFASQMALDLRQMFPGLTVNDASNLAWGGLQSTPDFQNNIGSDMTKLGNFDATQAAYSSGTKGAKCN